MFRQHLYLRPPKGLQLLKKRKHQLRMSTKQKLQLQKKETKPLIENVPKVCKFWIDMRAFLYQLAQTLLKFSFDGLDSTAIEDDFD